MADLVFSVEIAGCTCHSPGGFSPMDKSVSLWVENVGCLPCMARSSGTAPGLVHCVSPWVVGLVAGMEVPRPESVTVAPSVGCDILCLRQQNHKARSTVTSSTKHAGTQCGISVVSVRISKHRHQWPLAQLISQSMRTFIL